MIDFDLKTKSLNLGMGQVEIPASEILFDDFVMTDLSILMRGG